jgi:membrane protein YqaA with SNARE-associated domain
MIRRLYDWVLSWGQSPHAPYALLVLAFCESSFFPIPPDVLLMALAISIPTRSFYYALVSSIGSVLGGAFGYLIGYQFMDLIGFRIINFYHLTEQYNYVGQIYNKYNAIAVGIAGFTPVPYKIFTIAAGAFKINFWIFLLASIVSRSARFFLVGTLIYLYGESIREFIEKYLNLLTIIFVLLLLGGFILLKWL